jgi:sulfane dehydrogenase subunit SoxC
MDDVLVAYGQNGEALRPEQGYPLRLVVPGWEAVNSTKWLRRIKLVKQPYMTKTESPGHSNLMRDGKARWFLGELGPKSVITFPSPGHQLPGRGFYEITGLAWSGRGAIRKVEISTDGGKTWQNANLQEPVLRFAHTRFHFPWTWNGEQTFLQSRCTDEVGDVQPTLAELNRMWSVSSDFWQATTTIVGHFNAIQIWEITREGAIQNALFS